MALISSKNRSTTAVASDSMSLVSFLKVLLFLPVPGGQVLKKHCGLPRPPSTVNSNHTFFPVNFFGKKAFSLPRNPAYQSYVIAKKLAKVHNVCSFANSTLRIIYIFVRFTVRFVR